MAARQKKVTEAPAQDFSMFAIEDRPKQGNANFKGKETDPDKLALITETIESFVAFANAQEAEHGEGALKDKDINITNMSRGVDEAGKPKVFTPAALALTGNNILENQLADSGVHPGFYMVATGRPLDEEATKEKGSNVYGQPTKLVIRVGTKPTRNRKANGEEEANGDADDSSDNAEAGNGEASE